MKDYIKDLFVRKGRKLTDTSKTGSAEYKRPVNLSEEGDKRNRQFWAELFDLDANKTAPPLSGKDFDGIFDHLVLPNEKIDAVRSVREIRDVRSYNVSPVSASKEGMTIDIKAMEIDTFYEVAYKGQNYVVRRTKDDVLETYEIEGTR